MYLEPSDPKEALKISAFSLDSTSCKKAIRVNNYAWDANSTDYFLSRVALACSGDYTDSQQYFCLPVSSFIHRCSTVAHLISLTFKVDIRDSFFSFAELKTVLIRLLIQYVSMKT